MKANFKILFLLFPLLFNGQDKPEMKSDTVISLYTISTANKIHTYFGHSALRVQTPFEDTVYDYGQFSFDQEDFFLNFMKGIMRYDVSKRPNKQFIHVYNYLKRGVKEQTLQLTSEEKKKLIEGLKQDFNNGYYYYDYVANNCTTVLADKLDINQAYDISKIKSATTYRIGILNYLSVHPWEKYSLNILMGSKADEKLSLKESLFFPDYLYKYIEVSKSSTNNKTVLQNKTKIKEAWITPKTVLFVLITISLLFSMRNKGPKLQYSILFIFSLLGIINIVMVLFTDHYLAQFNYNLLWANPLYFLLLRSEYNRKLFLFFKLCIGIFLLYTFFHLYDLGGNLYLSAILALICISGIEKIKKLK